ncbi:bifunctional diaminohydroxyphosphoribosylaminopyrimidine deaminase/5-amino-6-(5-phosphoribosylamino)uracil reductase RibD [Candidatus Cyanaurora vandensis]|uniref:bifunctional diaminohydroxyphosphoribosylaminopyrimidine deaminase/5-amino-6-(5-phosphoribosylamino)uracil reductase RibD n=1 Tax=Candidatus Cyanaurora vandensis TaxID=2714958 RepID=UPI00257C65BF|nr:bifunctional diaminohydroxyphosphoribosylaminopyrimidine deaminase/5-amino-6-(5-phosphoribosylamino)uracil reductase RibD [Candidatus Cyanaurora vandensis]
MNTDAEWMRHCLTLAQRGAGCTAPNPLVGAVVVQADEVVGVGFHPRAGQPHAEVFALHQAGVRAQGATLYVNLEPCHHQGRTPPCTQSIRQSGVTRVVVGMVDPNPLVQGRGLVALQAAGLDVTTGVLEQECRDLNRAFTHFITTGRPWGVWKYAMTLDGKLATVTGDSFWVSGEPARAQVQMLRNQVDAVIVGGQTVRRDNPRLTCRLPEGRNPLRVVLTRTLDLPHTARLWQTAIAPTLVFTGPNHDRAMAEFLVSQGVEVQVLAQVTPNAVLTVLGQRGLLSVLWECGGNLAAQALHDGSIQQVLCFISPKLIGGTQAPSPLGGVGVTWMREALPLEGVRVSQVGADILIEGVLSSSA